MPARKPVSLHIVTGSYRADRHAPKGDGGSTDPVGDAPRGMKAELRAIWRETSRLAPWLRAPDRHALEIYCSLLSKARTDMDGMGGRPLALLTRLQGQLGLLWADRQRHRPDPADTAVVDAAEEFFR